MSKTFLPSNEELIEKNIKFENGADKLNKESFNYI